MPDPLSLLRQYNINKEEIIESKEEIKFGELCWPKNVKTNYRVWVSGYTGKTDRDYYTLECLLFFLKNLDLLHPDYCKKAAKAKIDAVRRPDRKNLKAYLNGETTSPPTINKHTALHRQRKHAYFDDGPGPASKKSRAEGSLQEEDKQADKPTTKEVSKPGFEISIGHREVGQRLARFNPN